MAKKKSLTKRKSQVDQKEFKLLKKCLNRVKKVSRIQGLGLILFSQKQEFRKNLEKMSKTDLNLMRLNARKIAEQEFDRKFSGEKALKEIAQLII